MVSYEFGGHHLSAQWVSEGARRFLIIPVLGTQMRDEFGANIRRIIAARVNHRCSNPECRAVTGGPQIDPAKAVNVGVAAHITAAASGGARYDESLSQEQRKHLNNAIWLCQTCAKLVDNDETAFPVSLLQSWKQKAEAEARTRIGKRLRPDQENEEPDCYYNVKHALHLATNHLSKAPKATHDFYNGTEPTWVNIASHDDIPRDIQKSVMDFVAGSAPGGEIPVVLVLGRAGDGKSAFLMRLAAELIAQGHLVLWNSPDSTSLNAPAIKELCKDQSPILIIDDASRFDIEVLEYSLRFWNSLALPLRIVMSSREDLWMGMKPLLERFTFLVEFSLHVFSDNEIGLLLDRLEETNELGKLGSLQRSDQENQLKLYADRQLLVALLESKHNMRFASIAQRDLRDVERKFGQTVAQACRLVATLHSFGISVPGDWLAETLNLRSLGADILSHTRGLLVGSNDMSHSGVTTRHALVSTVLSDSDEGRYDHLRLFITTLKHDRSRLIPQLLRNIRLQFESRRLDIERVRFIFREVTEPPNIARYTFRIWPLLERELGNFDYARNLYEKATRTDPEYSDFWQAWATMENGLGNQSRAQELFHQAITNNPRDSISWHQLALIESANRNFIKAREFFRKATTANPNHSPSWQLWAIMEKEQRNFAQARELFKQAAEVDRVNPATTRGAIWQSWALMEKDAGDLEAARRLFAKAYKKNPKHVSTLQAWGIVEKELGHYRAARSLLEESLQIDPFHAHSLHAKALLEKETGNYSEARSLFERVVNIKQSKGIGFQAWGLMEKELGNYEVARKLFERATKAEPTLISGWQAWAIMEKDQGNYEHARQLFGRATQLKARSEYAFQAWGIMEQELGNVLKARELFERATLVAPSRSSCWQPWALLELELGNYEKAAELAERAVQLSTRDEYYPWIARGLVRRTQGNLTGAMADFGKSRVVLERIYRSKQRDRRIAISLANVLSYLGEYKQAEQLIRRLLESATKEQKPSILGALGNLYEEQGLLGAAVQAWQEARDCSPYFRPVINKLSKLEATKDRPKPRA
jgi:tetratricopeptide (TPR) repeat protein